VAEPASLSTGAAAPGVAGGGPSAAAARAPAAQLARQALDGRTERGAEGGERPVFIPRINNFGYAEGDTFSFRVVDTWRGEVMRSYTTQIEEVLGDGHLLANGQSMEMDPQGRLKNLRRPDGSRSDYEPAEELWWNGAKPGESRDVKYLENFSRANGVNGKAEFRGSSSVGRPRKVKTPAGEFEALPIETDGWMLVTLADGTRNELAFSRTVWYSPKLGHPVQIEIKDTDRAGRLLRRERVELTHAQLHRSAKP
jgi:hypothetical protein